MNLAQGGEPTTYSSLIGMIVAWQYRENDRADVGSGGQGLFAFFAHGARG